MSEWLCVEAIVRQRDREATAASIARLSEASGKPRPEASEANEVSQMYKKISLKKSDRVCILYKKYDSCFIGI